MFRVIILLVVSMGIAASAGGRGQNAVPGTIPLAPANNDDLRNAYRGKVVELTEKSVTIKPEGEVKVVQYCGGDDLSKARIYIQDNTEPPRKFVFTEGLLYHSGLNPNYRGGSMPYFGHKVSDLKVGDSIYINCRRMKAQENCERIQIEARPDGNIPLPIP
jgi:hypothetical protein